jgi:hypothetical protein
MQQPLSNPQATNFDIFTNAVKRSEPSKDKEALLVIYFHFAWLILLLLYSHF